MSASRDLDRTQLTKAGAVIRDIAQRYATAMDDWILAWNVAREIGEADLVDQIIKP